MKLTPMAKRRLANFRANRRGYVAMWIFLAIFTTTLFAELIANDRPHRHEFQRRTLPSHLPELQ